jgi:hypothetical protein
MPRWLFTSITALVLALFLAAPPAAFAGSEKAIVADLEGKSLHAVDVGKYYCHDLDWPAIHCYRSAQRLEASISTASVGAMSMTAARSASATAYIRLYDLAAFSGSYIVLSADYPDLGTIGWNNRASSYVGLNSESSRAWTSLSYQGTWLSICCNQSDATMSPTFDNAISSIERT